VATSSLATSRLQHLERLGAEYPTLPTEVLLKQDLLTEGVAAAPGLEVPAVAACAGGPLGLRRTIVRLRLMPTSPYRVRTGADSLVLVDARSDQEIAPLRAYPWRPEYAARLLPSGRRAADVLDLLGVARLSRGSLPAPDDLAEAAAETFVLSAWQTGETPLAIKLVPDLEMQALPEAEQDAIILPYVRAVRQRLGNARPILLVSPPRRSQAEERLLEAGVTGRVSSLEVWDADAFARVGPRFGITRDEWIERLIGQAYTYLSSFSQPALLIGKEMSAAAGLDQERALASNTTAISFFLNHRVMVRPTHWVPPASADTAEPRPPVQHFLELDRHWYETWRGVYGVEFGADAAGPGQSRDPDSGCWDIGRGASLTPVRRS
jgi:hypothetical protein